MPCVARTMGPHDCGVHVLIVCRLVAALDVGAFSVQKTHVLFYFIGLGNSGGSRQQRHTFLNPREIFNANLSA